MRIYRRCQVEQMFARVGFEVVTWDTGSEVLRMPGIPEPVICLTYVLQKTGQYAAREGARP